MSADESLEEKLAALKQSFINRLPERFDEMYEHLSGWQADGGGESLQGLHRAVHSLTGAGATFGFAELSDQARVLERYLKELVGRDAVADEALVVEIERQLSDIKALAAP